MTDPAPAPAIVDVAGTGLCPWETTLLLGSSPMKQVLAGAEWLLQQDRPVTQENLARLGVRVQAASQAGGGSGANAICAAARAGATAAFAGVVGDDAHGAAVCEDFERRGVGSHLVVRLAERRTRELVLVTWPGRAAPRQLSWTREPSAEASESLERPVCRLLHLGNPSARQIRWAEGQRSEGGAVSVDLSPGWERGGSARERVGDLLQLANLVFLSGRVAHRLAEILGVDRHLGHDRLALGLAARLPGCEILVLTLGADGAVAVEGGRARFAWPLDVEELDPTGAGDCLAGHLIAAYVREGGLEGACLEQAVREAVAAAGLSVTGLSARGRLPSRSDAAAYAPGVEIGLVRTIGPRAAYEEGEFA